MPKKTMTMHQLLAELKTVDSRITKALSNNSFIGNYKGSPESEEIEAANTKLRANYQSVTALIENKKTLEAVRAKSNNETKVVIGDNTYTVAEAIKRKHDIKYDKLLLSQLTAQLNETKRIVDNRNELVQREKSNYALKTFEATKTEADVDLSVKLAKIAELEDKYVKENSYTILDPIGLQEKIEQMEKEISYFETNVEAALSVSNAITSVEVELRD